MKYVGIDWATQIHLVALLDEQGTVLGEWEVEHAPSSVGRLLQQLDAEGGPASVRIGIESGAVLLVDQLVEAGYTVYLLNPRQADRYRDRHSPAGAKDDRRDARVIADAIRTDADRLVPLVPDGPLTRELRLRSRARSRLVAQRVTIAQHLREVLRLYYPAILELPHPTRSPFLLAILEAYPDPGRARQAQLRRLQRLLDEHRIRVMDARQLRATLAGLAFFVRPEVAAACRDEVLDLVAQMRLLSRQILKTDARLRELLADHEDGDLVRGLPGAGERLAAAILAELGDDPLRRTQPGVLTVYAGTAPVTRASGTRKRRRKNGQRAPAQIRMRQGCNRHLQRHLWLVARNSQAKSRWARAYVAYRKGRGDPYNTVIRALANKWAKILAHLLRTRQHYDEDRHVEDLLRNNVAWARSLLNAPEEKAA